MTISDTASNEHIFIEWGTKSVVRSYRSSQELDEPLLNFDFETCTGEEKIDEPLPNQPWVAFPAIRSRTAMVRRTVTKGRREGRPEIRAEDWVIRELACFPVQGTSSWAGSRTEYIVESLVEGEPDPKYFQVPEGFEERSYMQFEEEYRKMFKGAGFWGDEIAKKLDQDYWKQRTPKPRKLKLD